MKSALLMVAMGMLAAAGTAHAGFTPIVYRAGGDAGERNQAEIMGKFYGNGTFNTTDFTSANPSTGNFAGQGAYSGITFVRVQDFAAGGATSVGAALNIHNALGATTTDQIWQDGAASITAQTKYAGYNQRAGFKYGDTGNTSNKILDVTSTDGTAGNIGVVNGVSVVNSSQFSVASGAYFRLTRSGDGSDYASNEWSSRTSENGDGLDHMVTYQIIDTNWTGGNRYLVFFDDQANGATDCDFNDFSMTLTAVPLPPAAWAGMSMLAGVAGMGALRRRRMMER